MSAAQNALKINEPEGGKQPAVIKSLDAKPDRLIEENKKLRARVEELEEHIQKIVVSRSWRLTAPYRAVAKFIRNVRPIWKHNSHEIEIKPSVNIAQRSPGNFSIVGPSAAIKLEPNGGSYPSGWTSVSCDLDVPLVCMLYYKIGEEFSDTDRVSLALVDNPKPDHIVYLPPGISEFCLRPFHGEGDFRFENLKITELGKAQLAIRLVKKKIVPLLGNPRILWSTLRKAWVIFRDGGFTAIRMKLFANNLTNNYAEWLERYDTLTDKDRTQIRTHLSSLSYKPLFSVVMPTYNTPRQWLSAAIDSVLRQLYENWELCIADDASTDPETASVLREYAAKDARIKVAYRKENGHISKSSNDAISLASGEFIALLDHDDELTEDALYMAVVELNKNSKVDFIYSDEDKISSFGMRFNPHFKSNWNPDLFLSQNYICHLGIYRTSLVKEIGGFRTGFEGAQDWDLALRISEKIPVDHIVHIPHVLYHWRVIEGSTAQSTSAKPYVLKAQQKAVKEHLERIGTPAEVEILEAISHVRPRFPLPSVLPFVSIIIPTRDQLGHLKRCVESLLKQTSYKKFEIIIVDNGSEEAETLNYFESLKLRGVTIIRDDRPFNYSRLNNEAAKVAKGELLAFLNNDLEVITQDWLSEMVSHAVRPGVGGVGARLLYPNGLLQHGGVILGIGGVAGHNCKGRMRQDPGYFNRAILIQNLSAVTAACMVLPKKVFDEVGGLDEKELSVAFNDVDLCLRIRAKGYRITYTPYAELYHYESASRGYETTPEKFKRFEQEVENMKRRWSAALVADPYYNPNLTNLSEDYQFAFPPRVKKPWRI